MFNFDYITKEDIKEHNPNWLEIPDHPYRILIAGGSGPGKTNTLLNLMNHKPDIDKIYLYAKDTGLFKSTDHLPANQRPTDHRPITHQSTNH